MHDAIYHFRFNYEINLEDAEILLHRAIVAAEALLGRFRVLLKAGYRRDVDDHALYVDGSNEVGQTVTQIFTAFLVDALGPGAFTVTETNRLRSPSHLAMAG